MTATRALVLADRLLYGPDKPSIIKLRSVNADEKMPPSSNATSPTIADSSPTEIHMKVPLSHEQSIRASPIKINASAPASPAQQSALEDCSTTSSPTLANMSPVDLQTKQQYYVQEFEAQIPTSPTTLSSLVNHNHADQVVDGQALETWTSSAPLAQRTKHPAVRAWQSIWERPPATWHPTAYQVRALIGVLGLCVAVACVFASLAVLVVSDGRPTTSWYVAPSVLLAILTAVANSAIALAYMEAVPISFWYSMTRARTVESLERQWQISRSILFCSATILGPGVSKTGWSQEVWPIDGDMISSNNASRGQWRSEDSTLGTPSTTLPSFEVSVAPIYSLDSSAAVMRVGSVRWLDGIGSYTMTTCTLLPTISEFDVEIDNGIVSVPKTLQQGMVSQLANNTKAVDQSLEAMPRPQYSAMDAISVDIGLVTSSNVSMVRAKNAASGVPYAVDTMTHNRFSAQYHLYGAGPYDIEWEGPTDDIVFIANSLMFRAGVLSLDSRDPRDLAALIDPGLSINHTVPAMQEVTEDMYKSDLRWYAGAAMMQIATALVVLPMFWGWWRLGCDLTLSPFSIALAFDAPVLRDVNSAAGVKGVVERLGGTKLQYGTVGAYDKTASASGFNGRLGVAQSQAVFRPHAGMAFQR